MEIPLELMLTISQRLPWMFFPDIIPVGHPIFDIINSTNPEVSVCRQPSSDSIICLLCQSVDVKIHSRILYLLSILMNFCLLNCIFNQKILVTWRSWFSVAHVHNTLWFMSDRLGPEVGMSAIICV